MWMPNRLRTHRSLHRSGIMRHPRPRRRILGPPLATPLAAPATITSTSVIVNSRPFRSSTPVVNEGIEDINRPSIFIYRGT